MEKNFKQFVEETVNEAFGLPRIEQKPVDVSNEKFSKELSKHKDNLIIYWCLCKYCQLYNINKKEYVDWLFHLNYEIECLKYLNTNNKAEFLEDYFYIDEKLNDPYKISSIISNRFVTENLKSIDRMTNVSEIFVNGINGLIEALTSNNQIHEYLNVVFG